jgi:Fe-S-cluster containining protein
MKLVTDIKEVQRLSAEKEDENWSFRCYVKGCDLGVEELDTIVHELNDKVSEAIDCQSCGHCCRALHPVLKKKDSERLSSHLSMPFEAFENAYIEADEGAGSAFLETPCSFLSANSCSVYEARPDDCRSFPHLHKEGFIFRVTAAFSNSSCCPIAYNVYELLKNEVYCRT